MFFPYNSIKKARKGGFALALLLLSLLLASCAEAGNAIENQPVKPEAIARFKATPDDAGGDPRQGAIVFAKFPCVSCHAINGSGGGVGPALDKIGLTAASRVAGVTAAQYIYHVLTYPEDASLPNYRNTVMPGFGTSATPPELRDLTAYLLSLK